MSTVLSVTTLPQAGLAAATVAVSAGLLLGVVPAGQAITNEQLVFLEAWRAVDRAYVDKTFNGNTWFKASHLTSLRTFICVAPSNITSLGWCTRRGLAVVPSA